MLVNTASACYMHRIGEHTALSAMTSDYYDAASTKLTLHLYRRGWLLMLLLLPSSHLNLSLCNAVSLSIHPLTFSTHLANSGQGLTSLR